jgi:hypothetical protein
MFLEKTTASFNKKKTTIRSKYKHFLSHLFLKNIFLSKQTDIKEFFIFPALGEGV